MINKYLLLASISICSLACKNGKQQTIKSASEISKSIDDAKNNNLSFEGKFVRIVKMNDKEYSLFLKNDDDSIINFITLMPLDSNEILLLKKDGHNIKLNYSNFDNPVRKKMEKIIKYMRPVYEPNKK